MKKAVSVSGIGAVTPAGLGAEALWQDVANDRSLIQNGLGRMGESVLTALHAEYPEAGAQAPAVLFAYAACKQAMSQAGWERLTKEDGLILATTTGQISNWEEPLFQFLSSDPKRKSSVEEFSKSFSTQALGLTLGNLETALQTKGPSLLVTSACSAATQAIALAVLWLQSGKVKRCLVGGTEVLSTLTVQGFRSLQLLSPNTCKPFDRDRDGINLSEGAAFLCLEMNSERSLGMISGYGFSTDAYHLASPHPEGDGSYKAMKNALKMANLSAKDVSWVHAHGTGSRANDQSEGRALAHLFSEIESEKKPTVVSTKGIHGHALGASGALESVICLKSLEHDIIPKTSGLMVPDPEINIHHSLKHVARPVKCILKNTLGFGGNNAALVFQKGVR